VLVDEVLGLTQVARSDIRPLPGQFVGPERLWFSGLFLFQSSVALVVNPEWLLVQSAQPLLIERPVHGELSQCRAAAPDTVRGAQIADPFEGVVLEEASDAEDTPWAEL
jgi:hypothetical protein